MKSKTFQVFIYLLIVYLVLLPKKALAYLDPGTGSYIFQIFIAAVLGGAFFLKSQFKRLRDFFTRKSEPKNYKEFDDDK